MIRFAVNAFGAGEPFEPHRAESRAPIPVWVLSLMIAAWAAWYFVTLWHIPTEYAKIPTFAASMNPLR